MNFSKCAIPLMTLAGALFMNCVTAQSPEAGKSVSSTLDAVIPVTTALPVPSGQDSPPVVNAVPGPATEPNVAAPTIPVAVATIAFK